MMKRWFPLNMAISGIYVNFFGGDKFFLKCLCILKMLSILGWALWKAKTWKPGMFNKHSIYLHIYPMYKMAFFPMSTSSVIIWNQPNQCTIIGEIPQNYHNFVVFHQPIWKNISRQLESFPQVGGFLTWKNVWDHLLGIKFDSPQNGSQMSHWMTPRKFQEKRRLGYDAIPSHPPAFWSCERSAAKHPTTFFINYLFNHTNWYISNIFILKKKTCWI